VQKPNCKEGHQGARNKKTTPLAECGLIFLYIAARSIYLPASAGRYCFRPEPVGLKANLWLAKIVTLDFVYKNVYTFV